MPALFYVNMDKEKSKSQFPAMEEEVLSFWDKAKIFEQSVERAAPRGNFVFYEGPPTANGQPGIHHVLARAFKDVLPRFKTMSGFRVERKAGWDTHGLPVELQVEKELKISGKGEIEKYGIKEFNAKCRESVWRYKDEWEKMTKRIGFWLDLEHPYITYDNDYIESVWAILKKVFDDGRIYKGHKVVPHCPSCGTTLSSHEVALGYKSVKENSVVVKFKVTKGNNFVQQGDFILSWTTTPWTLPGNVALAVGLKVDYIKFEVLETQDDGSPFKKGEIYICSKNFIEDNLDFRVDAIEEGDTSHPLYKDYISTRKYKGTKIRVYDIKDVQSLVGVEYEPLFDIAAIANSGKKSHYVAAADFVTTDEGTGVVHTAVMYGEDDYQLGEKLDLPKVHTVDEAGKFTDELKNYNLADKFVKDKETEKIILEHLQKQGNLFKEEMYEHDYPFCWRCDTPLLYYAKDSWFIKMSELKDELIKNNQTINWVPEHIKDGRFGEWLANVKDWAISRERYWGTPLPLWVCDKCGAIKCVGSKKDLGADLGDLHRPFIDEVKFACDCGGQMTRDQAVLDVWLDSGSMPFSQYHYPFEHQDLIDKGEQYPAAYIAEAIDQTRGWFYTLLAISTLLGKGACYQNVICLGHINDKFGKKMSKSKGNIIEPNQVLNEYGADAVRLHMYTINQPGEGKKYDLNDVRDTLRQNNMILWNVYKFYELYADGAVEAKNDSVNILDSWIIARLNQLVKKITDELEKYHVYEAAREIPEFINDLSTWYLRRSRDRFKSEDKVAALATTKFVLLELAKVMAPFMPFLSETLWQKVSGYDFKDNAKSVHLAAWPSAGESDEQVLVNMDIARKAVALALAKRDEAGLKVRQPLNKLTINNCSLAKEYQDLIAEEVNVKEAMCKFGEGELAVELDANISKELEAEGLIREAIRATNGLRKRAGLNINDRAEAFIDSKGSEKIGKALNLYKTDYMAATGTTAVVMDVVPDTVLIKEEVDINGEQVILGLKK